MKFTAIFLVTTATVCTGCVTPQFTPHVVSIDSMPSGATVLYGDKEICTTPCSYDVRDHFGFFSQYVFTARMAGYAEETLVYDEKTIADTQTIVPESIHFEMKPEGQAGQAGQSPAGPTPG